MARIVNHIRQHVEGLCPVLTVALTLLTHGGSGSLAACLAGLPQSGMIFDVVVVVAVPLILLFWPLGR